MIGPLSRYQRQSNEVPSLTLGYGPLYQGELAVTLPLMPYTYYPTLLQEGFGGQQQFTMPLFPDPPCKGQGRVGCSTVEATINGSIQLPKTVVPQLRASVRRTATRGFALQRPLCARNTKWSQHHGTGWVGKKSVSTEEQRCSGGECN
jgi:hypothetical protein